MKCKECDKFYNVISIFPNTEPSIRGIDCLVEDAFELINVTTLTLTITKTDYFSDLDAGSITASVTGGNGGYKYSINSGEYVDSGVFTGLQEGSYLIAAKDRNGNVTNSIVKISIRPVFIDAITKVLHGNTVTYTADDSFSTYVWAVTGGTIVTGQGTNVITVLFATQGLGTVSLSTINATGATGFYSVNVTITNKVPLVCYAMLQGPFVLDDGRGFVYKMKDKLRSLGLLPLSQPYTTGYTHINSGTEVINVSVLGTTGVTGPLDLDSSYSTVSTSESIVDWMFLQLRTGTASNTTISTRAALIRRDGRIVDLDGVSPVEFIVPSTTETNPQFYVTVQHRNHLGMMSAFTHTFNVNSALTPGTPGYIDFTLNDDTYPTYGTNALVGTTVRLMRAGDATGNKTISRALDVPAVENYVGTSTPTNVKLNYALEDTDLNGIIRAQGSKNDKTVIDFAVGIATPTNVITQQIP